MGKMETAKTLSKGEDKYLLHKQVLVSKTTHRQHDTEQSLKIHMKNENKTRHDRLAVKRQHARIHHI